MRGGKKLKRFTPPPCKTCPKESPEKAREHELSEKNTLALELYYTTRAMHGTNLTDDMRHDAIVQQNMSLIDSIVRVHEANPVIPEIVLPATPTTRTPRGR